MKIKARKLFSVLLTMIMLLAIMPIGNVFAASSGKCGENLTWTLDDSGTLTISGAGEMSDGCIVGNDESETIKTVVIEDGVTSIGDLAFLGCVGLTSVTISKSVASIGENVFIGCISLMSITVDNDNPSYSSLDGVLFNKEQTELILFPEKKAGEYVVPSSVTNIDKMAFSYCAELTGVAVAEDNVNYSSLDGVLFNKDKTTLVRYPAGKEGNDYAIPNYVKGIDDFAFSGCTGLETITIPESADSIGNCAFSGCTGLETMLIPNGVESIGNSAFSSCTSLKSIAISESVTIFGTDMFYNCVGLERVTLPNNMTEISEYMFYKCTGLKNITIPENVTRICDSAFSYCESLESISILKNVTEICANVFWKCSGLISITVDKDNPSYSSLDGVLFNKDKTSLIRYPAQKSDETYVIPDSVTTIEDEAFYNSSNLTGVTIPDSVTNIEIYSFAYCRVLKSIVLPKDISVIKSNTFKECESLSSVTISSGVTTIESCAFLSCSSLTSVVIPSNVTNIHGYAFSNCRNLKSVTLKNRETTIGTNAFGYYVDPDVGSSVRIIDFALYGDRGSTAKNYAKRNGFDFIETHSYKPNVIKKESCVDDGEIKYICSCGDSYTKIVPALGHKSVVTPAVAPTCTEDGKTEEIKCSVCGVVLKASTIVRATGHKDKTTTTKATQIKDGLTVTECDICGKVIAKSAIDKVSSVELSKTSFIYNGKVQKPSVVIKDSKGKTLANGTDYTINYSKGCKNVGQYTATITLIGKYTGTETLTFKIVPKGTSISKLTAGRKQLTVKWRKQISKTTGYELQYSTKSGMSGAKVVNINKNKTTSSTVKKLKKAKKYYVRIRTYKTVKINGKRIKLYSSWSKIKNIKTK